MGDNEVLSMNIFRCVRSALFLFIAGGSLLQSSADRASQVELDSPQEPLNYIIQAAHAAGRREITYISVCDMPSGINSIAQILAKYSLLRVKVIDKKTTISDDVRR